MQLRSFTFFLRVANMHTQIVCLFIVVLGCSGIAFGDCTNSNSYLNAQQVSAVLASHYACGRSATLDPPGWNELHLSGGSLQEQHEGGSSVETVGTWSVTNSSGRGRVTYTYTGGTSGVYEVAVLSGNCSSGCTTLPQVYQFCGVSGAPTLNIYVSTAFQAPTGGPPNPWVMNSSCPPNS
jgi:hypothetical protein